MTTNGSEFSESFVLLLYLVDNPQLNFMKPKLLSVLFISLFIYTNIFSQAAGTLDKSFGNKGVAQIPVVLSNGDNYVEASKIAQLSNGKFIVAAVANGSSYFDAYIYRLNNDGSLDNSFGNQGRVLIYSGVNHFQFHDLLIDSSDNILFSKITSTPSSYKFVVIRLKKDGSYDSFFNGNGIKIINKSVPLLLDCAIALRPSDKILVSSSYRSLDSHRIPRDTTVQYQLKYNGASDSSFNGVGYIIGKNSQFSTIGVQPDGRTIYAGSYLEQLNFNGTRNFNFADTGIIKLKGYVYNLQTMPDGKFMCLTNTYENVNCQCAGATTVRLYKFDKNGSLDMSLNASGILTIYNTVEYYSEPASAGNIIVQPDGKFLLNTFDADGINPKIRRYLSNGKIDTTFAHKGSLSIAYAAGEIIFQKNLKIIALQSAHYNTTTDTSYFYVYRYNNDVANSNLASFISSQIKSPGKENLSIKIAPNPVTSILNVHGLTGNTVLTIINSNGEKLATSIATSGTYSWNIQNLAAGNYFLIISRNNKIIASLKFIKQ
jgi:uncharacterized delta-60 repeat protein